MSKPLETLTGRAAVLLEDGIDTDVIFPARFLLRMEKEGLGECLFADRISKTLEDRAGSFTLERSDGKAVQILLAGAQFGCGSSREHAVWSLVDFGIRAVIAPSFGEIFANNSARNGLAAICLDRDQVEYLAQESADADLTVDLLAKTVTIQAGKTFAFDIGEGDRQALLNGWDEIDMIHAAHSDDVENFESGYRERRPWLFKDQA
jgi:3-isopropylmalate/(R)-2-methylmalate dehydratase small subunit